MIPNTLVTAGIAVILAFGLGAAGGYKTANSFFAEEKLQMAEAEKEAMIRNQKLIAQIEEQHRETDRKVADDHKEALAKLRYDYTAAAGKRLLVKADCSSPGTSITPKSTEGPDTGLTRTVALPEQVTEDLYAAARDADELVETYRALKHWLVAQGLTK
jgi:hypothetical protein